MAGGGAINHQGSRRKEDLRRIHGWAVRLSISAGLGHSAPCPITIDDESINYYLLLVPFNLFCTGLARVPFHFAPRKWRNPAGAISLAADKSSPWIPLLPCRAIHAEPLNLLLRSLRWWTTRRRCRKRGTVIVILSRGWMLMGVLSPDVDERTSRAFERKVTCTRSE